MRKGPFVNIEVKFDCEGCKFLKKRDASSGYQCTKLDEFVDSEARTLQNCPYVSARVSVEGALKWQ